MSARIESAHGAGGRATNDLVRTVFAPAFASPWIEAGDDAARCDLPPATAGVVVSTDAFVASPWRFPGGDIGSLAVHGTINDVAMLGALPRWLTAAFIIEEGFAIEDLRTVAGSMGAAARAAGVHIVCGDTKVVERGHGDGVFITTTGIGTPIDGVQVGAARARSGDRVLVSGPVGDHGACLMALRAGLGNPPSSDSAAVHALVAALAAAGADALHCLRDPTRGGLAAVLNELARSSGCGFVVDEAAIPVRPAVRATCEILGLDPLDAACEGRLVCVCAPEAAPGLLAALRASADGAAAADIGAAVDGRPLVELRTTIGGRRLIDWRHGGQFPRIC
jgi:hydrogenase expression/formation protein HypE